MTAKYIGTKTLLAREENRGDKPGYAVQYPDGRLVPWVASQTDMLEEDWMVL